MSKAYLVCNSGAIEESEKSCCNIGTSVAARKMVEGDEGGLELQSRRAFMSCTG